MGRDYKQDFMSALTYAVRNGSRWLTQSAQTAANAIASRKEPLNAKDAYALVTLMPLTWFLQFTPLYEFRNRGKPRKGELTPSLHQGFHLVYKIHAQLQLETGKSIAVSVYLNQKTLTPATPKDLRPVSVWQLEVTYTHPDTAELILVEPVYLDTDSVKVVPGGVVIDGGETEGSIIVGAKDVTVTLTCAGGFALHVSASTAAGPVYMQEGSNMVTVGHAQKLRWAVMDGSLTSGRVWWTRAEAPVEAKVGSALMLSYTQFGYRTIPSFQQFLIATMTLQPQVAHHALRVWFQIPSMNMRGVLNVTTAETCRLLLERKQAVTIEGALTVWRGEDDAHYDQTCRVHVSRLYPMSTVPEALHFYSPLTGHLFMDSLLSREPSATSAHLNGYQSPLRVSIAHKGKPVQPLPGAFGNMQWINGTLYPTPVEARALTRMPTSLTDAYTYNPEALAAFVMGIIGIIIVFLAMIFGIQCFFSNKNSKKEA